MEVGYLNMRVIIKIIFMLFLSVTVFAATQMNVIPPYNVAVYDRIIQKLYVNQPIQQKSNLARLQYFSGAFLGQRYMDGALGEGINGEFDQNPLYRTDAFDCMTYVSTILALLNAPNVAAFKQMIQKINYQNGAASYLDRNHFASIDWNPKNEKQGFIQDITATIHDQNNQSVAKITNAYINKKAWYAQKTLSSLKLLSPLTVEKQQQLLARLQGMSAQVSNQQAQVPYVPLTVLFEPQGQANAFIFNQIPSGSVIEIVRSNWTAFGTDLNVSHMGFALRTQQGLVYREASLTKHKVVDIPLAEYLRKYVNHSTVKGINIQLVLFPSKEEI